MAFTEGDLVEISVSGLNAGITYMNVYQYEILGTFSGIDGGQVANAWWQHVKSTYRAVVANSYSTYFQEVIVRELNDPTGEFGTYAIPSGEAAGTRVPASETGQLPPYVAVGAKLVVGTRVTRPGSKRYGGLVELDNNAGYVNGPVFAATEALLAVLTTNMTLGAPAVGMALDPIICKKAVDGSVVAHQPIVGYLVSGNLTSQVSRKIGRGS